MPLIFTLAAKQNLAAFRICISVGPPALLESAGSSGVVTDIVSVSNIAVFSLLDIPSHW